MTKLDKDLFEGQALSVEELIAMLRSQGLTIDDEKRAENILNNVSYSRLKPYLVPLMEDRATHRYKPGARFADAYAFYGFDRRLRELVFHETEKIEIAVRARISIETGTYENGLWYTNPVYFRNKSSHNYMLGRLVQEARRSDNDALKAFSRKYRNVYPPSWLLLEAMSFGSVMTLYEETVRSEAKENVARYFGLEMDDFQSWMRHVVYVRNTCAHHNRIWNKDLKVGFSLNGRHEGYFPKLRNDGVQSIYCTLCMIKYLINRIKPNNSFSVRLKDLIQRFPMISTSLMGFPSNWEKDPLWK